MDDLRLAFAFAARRAGKRSMPLSAWAHTLSLELGWMTPGQARHFVSAAQEAGILDGDEEALLTFDPNTVDVPRGFRPDPEATPSAPSTAPPPDPFQTALRSWSGKSGKPMAEILDAVAAIQSEAGGLLDAETALLLVRAKTGDDVRPDAEAALKQRLGQGSARSGTR